MRAPSLIAVAAVLLLGASHVGAQLLVPDCPYASYFGKAALGANVVQSVASDNTTANATIAEFIFGADSIDSAATVWGVVSPTITGTVGYAVYSGSCAEPGSVLAALSTKFGTLSATTPSFSAKTDSTLFPRAITNKPLVVFDSTTQAVLGCGIVQAPIVASTPIYNSAGLGAVINFVSIDGGAPTWIYGFFLGLTPGKTYTYGVYDSTTTQGYTGAQCTSVGNFTANGNLSGKFGTLTGASGTGANVAGSAKINVQDVTLRLTEAVGKTFGVLDGTTLVGCGAINIGASPLVDTTVNSKNTTGGTNPSSSAASATATGTATASGSLSTGTPASKSAAERDVVSLGRIAVAVVMAIVAGITL